MIINKLKPQGFCGGVKTALNKLDEAINNPSTLKPIYLLGSIIHNEHIINEYKNKGVILIEDKNKNRLELLNEIKSLGFADWYVILLIKRSKSYTGDKYSLNSSRVIASSFSS